MDSNSPPRKKLKQARLPFQILSPKETAAEITPPLNRKRHLSEDSNDEVAVAKQVKTSEEFKENETLVTPSKETADKDLVQTSSSGTGEADLMHETSSQTKDESPKIGEEGPKSEEGNILQSKMKSNLANLFGKNGFDVTAEVGRCDCGCEEADSGEEAMEEYYQHSKKGISSPSSSEKKPKEKPKRKSRSRKDSKELSPSKESPSTEKKHNGRRRSHKTKTESNSSSQPGTVEPVNASETVLSEPQPSVTAAKPTQTERKSRLSQKAVDMFAKWRKGPSSSTQSEEISPPSNNENSGVEKEQNQLPTEDDKKSELEDDLKILNEESNDDRNKDEPFKFNLEESESCENSCFDAKSTLTDDAQNKKESTTTVQKSSNSDGIEKQKHDNESSEGASSDDSVEGKLESPSNQTVSSSKILLDKAAKPGSAETPIEIVEDQPFPLTPTSLGKAPSHRRLTPKQLERQKEIAKRQEEKERLKLERENEKKRLKHEKDEQKRKEKEEKEEQKKKEKEEKEKKRLAEQEQKNEEKKKKELLKVEEKRKKEEEKKKAEEEKKKAEEEEARKKSKASALFTSFFVPKSTKVEREEAPPPSSTVQNFMPFEVKADMQMAPLVRYTLLSPEKKYMDEIIGNDRGITERALYLSTLKSGERVPKVTFKTLPNGETKEDDDILILESDDNVVLLGNNKNVEKMRAKFLQFHENHRPAYRGTWRKRSTAVTGRRPFGQEKILDYEVDSADEWEEEEPGESLHGSDDEKEKESEDEYEVDNSVFVPHGYLSDDEGDEESEEVYSPETQKAKLKLLGEEFEAQMKNKTSALKPIIIVLTAALQASACSARYQKLFERRAVWQEDEGPIVLSQLKTENVTTEEVSTNDSNCVTFSSGPGAKKKIISEEALPALITLVHGNQNKRIFLTNEFSSFLGKSGSVQMDNVDENPTDSAGISEASERPSTPSASAPNPLVSMWPGLPPASRISISNKIKEIATWGQCPEEGPMHNRQCWYVSEEIRRKYGLVDLKIPNTQWHYTLKPKVFSHSQSPNACAVPSSVSGADPRALITKFTKVMTPEEKQRQWESMKSSRTNSPSSSKLLSNKSSTGKITAFTQVRTPGSAESKQKSSDLSGPGKSSVTPISSNQPQAKKRVPLLVSVPRGQQITGSSSHCSLLSRFEASASPKSSVSALTPSNTVPNSEKKDSSSNNAAQESSNSDVECVVLE